MPCQLCKTVKLSLTVNNVDIVQLEKKGFLFYIHIKSYQFFIRAPYLQLHKQGEENAAGGGAKEEGGRGEGGG